VVEGLGPSKVVFACVANAGRSQMAAAFFNKLANPKRAYAVSAGTRPAQAIHHEVVVVMRESGLDLSQAKPQYLSSGLCKDAHILVTMGCGEECPLVPGVERDDWTIEDPRGQPIERVRQIRDHIRKCVSDLIHERKW
jgi:arsenate reductase (thioredoxin)